MLSALKAYLFLPSGFRRYLEKGFAGWPIVFVLYVVFTLVLAYYTASTLKSGIYVFLQPIIILVLLSILSVASAFGVGAEEPMVRGLRLVALCLPPIAVTVVFFAERSPWTLFVVYPALLYVYGSAFLATKSKVINAAMGAAVLALTVVLAYAQAKASAKWFGQQVELEGLQMEFHAAATCTREEATVYRFLLLGTPELGHIPGADEIAQALSLNRLAVRRALHSLDCKGNIILSKSGEIGYAYPWAAFDNGCRVTVQKTPDGPILGPVYVSDALHAMGISSLLNGARTRIYATLKDNGDSLYIEQYQGEIVDTNHPEALVYSSDKFSQVNFYSSPAGAKAAHSGRFEGTHLLRLDRAAIAGAEFFKKKMAGISQP